MRPAKSLRERYPLVALVHHPLAFETGLGDTEAGALRRSERAALGCARHVIVTSVAMGRLLIADYGVIRKGTRAVRQFEVFNNGATPITIQVARSSCRCLFYDYHDKVAPQKKETITVTVDGAKAKTGPLREMLPVTVKGNPSLHGELTVQATIQ